MKVAGVALLVSKAGGKAILEVAGRPMFELNPAAAIIWENLAVGLPTQEIIYNLVAQFNIPEELAANDVRNFIEVLGRNLLLFDDCQLTLG